MEIDTPPAATPLAAEFGGLSYKFSDCGKYEIIGDRCSLRKPGTYRVPGVLPELWQHLSQEQRMAMRNRWLLYQEECKARGTPIPAPVPDEGGLVAAAPAPDDIARSTKVPTGTGKVAETPRPGCAIMPVGPPRTD